MKIIYLLLSILLFVGCSNVVEEDKSYADKMDAYTNKPNKPIPQDRGKYDTSNRPLENDERDKEIKQKQILDVPLIKQNPELKYGCEVTSLTMVLKYAGLDINKVELAKEMPKDNDRIIKNEKGDILNWGDPDEGFVGDVTGKEEGYAIYDKPLEGLMKKYLGDRTINLTDKPFEMLIKQVSEGKPVIVWTTGDYKLPDRWESWQHGEELIKTPLDLHAVVLVGYDRENVYLNDPLSGLKAVKVNKEFFQQSWRALKKRALSYN